jgi:hypothetical protein
VHLRSMEIDIPMTEIYAGVEFPPEPEEPPKQEWKRMGE